ncbi:MAG: DUF4294 domain-containing protein, partial [Odoribacteraceae bacterium]|nr:DUF4294 domain-containing protein [Odoribacteraceae bacterium]
MYKIILILGLSLFLPEAADAQYDIDSMRHVSLPEVVVRGKVRGKKYYARLHERDARTRYNVRKAYPYAKEAARRIEQIEARLATVDPARERKDIVKTEYEQLMKTFKEPLMKLTVTQGRILVRLIYRETRKSSF